MNAYRALAGVYDEFSAESDYRGVCALADGVFKDYKSKNNILLDAGCGTGTLSVMLSRLGYELIGADISPDMLSRASQKAAAAGEDILFLCQDIRALDLYGTVGGAICARDTLNHIEPRDLSRALSRISLFIEPGGAFIFDINTVYKHSRVLAGHDYVYESDDALLAWRNDYDAGAKRVAIAVDVFSLQSDGGYARSSDKFYEYDIDASELDSALSAAGLTAERVLDGEDFSAAREDSERLVFICRKGPA